jgi:hypothetical protein
LDDRTVNLEAPPPAKAPGDGSFENSGADPNSPIGPSKFGETTQTDQIFPNTPRATPPLSSTGSGTGANAGTGTGHGTGTGTGTGSTIPHKPRT